MNASPVEKTWSAQVSRTFDASVEKVFNAWIDPASLKEWLAGGGQLVMTPKVDGLFYIGMQHKDRLWPHYGRYLRIESPRFLEFTWMSEGTHGHESVVKLEFTARGSRTELSISHTSLPDESMQRSHTEGWTHYLGVLHDRLSAG